MKLIAALLGLAICQVVLSNPVKRAADCGCLFDNTTYTRSIGESWEDPAECASYECTSHETVEVEYSGCRSGDAQNPTCKTAGQNWTVVVSSGNYCVDYTCTNYPHPEMVNLACSWNNACYYDGESSDIPNCRRNTCVKNQTSGIYGIKTENRGCLSGTTCYGDGESWDMPGCLRYTCALNQTTGKYGITARYRGCLDDNTCYGDGEGWDMPGCLRYTCALDQTTGNYGVTARYRGCLENNTCYGDGEGWDMPGCLRYTCALNQATGNYGVTAAYRGCLADGVCYLDTNTWSKCYTYDSPYQDVGYCYYYRCDQTTETKIDTKCSLDNVEYDLGDFKLRNAETCQYVTCVYNNNVLNTQFSTQCKDCDGNCHEFGSSGWPYYVNGTRNEDCTCTASEGYSCN